MDTFIKDIFLLCVCVCVCVFVGMSKNECGYIFSSEVIRSPTVEVTGICEPPNMGAQNKTLVLYKNST